MSNTPLVICLACQAPHTSNPDHKGLCNKCYLYGMGAKLNEKALAFFKASEIAKP